MQILDNRRHEGRREPDERRKAVRRAIEKTTEEDRRGDKTRRLEDEHRSSKLRRKSGLFNGDPA